MIKKCRVCGREYEAYDKKKKGSGCRRKLKRPYLSVTCSKACSKKNAYQKLKYQKQYK